MKKALVILFFIFFLAPLCNAQIQEELNTFNKERLNIQRKGMAALSIWSIGNMAWGAVGLATTEGSTKEFHEMNLIWNGVNFVLAGPAYIGAKKGKYDLTLRQTYTAQHKAEKSFLINSGLDIGYIMGGLYLTEISKRETHKKYHDKELGYGNSFMLQGGFLLLLDITMYTVHSTHANHKLNNLLDKVTISSNGIGYIHRF
jgi:hypothetical protein